MLLLLSLSPRRLLKCLVLKFPNFLPLSCALTKTPCSVSEVLLQKKHLGCSGCWQKGTGGSCRSSVVLTEVAEDAVWDRGWLWLGGHPGLEVAGRGRASGWGPGDQGL